VIQKIVLIIVVFFIFIKSSYVSGAAENIDIIYDSYADARAANFPKNGKKTFVLVGSTPIFQGWKLHLSATLESMDTIFDLALPVLESHNAHFKYTTYAGLRHLSFQPQQSGKFITIYPTSLEHANEIATELDRVLTASIESKILNPQTDFVNIQTDAQLGHTGALFTRYGAYKGDLCTIIKPHSFLKEIDAIDCSDSHFTKDTRISPLPEFAHNWLDASSPFPELVMRWAGLILWEASI